jgi:hypothetical protein
MHPIPGQGLGILGTVDQAQSVMMQKIQKVILEEGIDFDKDC